MGRSSSRRGTSSTSPVGLMVLYLVLVLMVVSCNGAVSASECKEERRLLVDACKAVVGGRPASPYCCERVRVTHIECVCSVITPSLAPLIDVNRAVRVIQGCGRQVPRRFKCGSITTP